MNLKKKPIKPTKIINEIVKPIVFNIDKQFGKTEYNSHLMGLVRIG